MLLHSSMIVIECLLTCNEKKKKKQHRSRIIMWLLVFFSLLLLLLLFLLLLSFEFWCWFISSHETVANWMRVWIWWYLRVSNAINCYDFLFLRMARKETTNKKIRRPIHLIVSFRFSLNLFRFIEWEWMNEYTRAMKIGRITFYCLREIHYCVLIVTIKITSISSSEMHAKWMKRERERETTRDDKILIKYQIQERINKLMRWSFSFFHHFQIRNKNKIKVKATKTVWFIGALLYIRFFCFFFVFSSCVNQRRAWTSERSKSTVCPRRSNLIGTNFAYGYSFEPIER